MGSLHGLGGTGENNAATDATLTTGADISDSSFAGMITDGTGDGKLGLKKIGTGIITLTGTNDYTGETNIDAGTLTVNSDNSGATGNVFVNSGATLAGRGTIGGSTTVKNGASLKPGSSPGVLTFNDFLTLEAGSTTTMEIAGTEYRLRRHCVAGLLSRRRSGHSLTPPSLSAPTPCSTFRAAARGTSIQSPSRVLPTTAMP